jgi:hypothetical protein
MLMCAQLSSVTLLFLAVIAAVISFFLLLLRLAFATIIIYYQSVMRKSLGIRIYPEQRRNSAPPATIGLAAKR